VDVVKLLMTVKLPHRPDLAYSLLSQVDSFGLNPVDHAMEALATVHELNIDRITRIEDIIGILKSALTAVVLPEDFERRWSACFLPREKEIVSKLRSERRHQVVKRIRANELRDFEERLRVVPEVVAKNYHRRESHSAAYTKNFQAPGALWTLDPGVRENLDAMEICVQEPLPGVLVLPLFSPEFCELLWQELHHYETCARDNPELKLPLDVRHDGNWGNLQQCGFQPLLDAVQELIQPLLKAKFPHFGRVRCHHAFLSRHSVERQRFDTAATFKTHRDKSQLTINICLHKTADVVGSGVSFFTGNSPKDCSIPGDEYISYRHDHTPGYAVIHDGRQWHRTEPIESGHRGSLIVWAESVSGLTPRTAPQPSPPPVPLQPNNAPSSLTPRLPPPLSLPSDVTMPLLPLTTMGELP
jgi:hypothetical protein